MNPLDFVSPTYDETSLAAVLPAAASALGVEINTPAGLSGSRCASALGLEATENVVVLLCDGLGFYNLAERGGHAPTLRRASSDAQQLTSTFPSTTAAALSALATGTAPGLTGMVGYTQRVPGSTGPDKMGTLANMVSWTQQTDPTDVTDPDKQRAAAALAIAPRDLQTQPTVFEQLSAAGIPVTTSGKARFAGSGMTEAVLRGAEFWSADSLADRVDVTTRSLRKHPGLAYLYWEKLDKTAHGKGWNSAAWGHELEAFDAEFSRLLRNVPRGTTVLLTADHGQLEVNFSQQIDVAQTPELRDNVTLVAGEPRACHVYTEPGCAEIVAQDWRAYLGERAEVWTRAEAIARGLFGPTVAEHVEPWLGDVIAALRGQVTLVDSRTQTRDSLKLKGVHGSLTRQEMIVPLMVFQR